MSLNGRDDRDAKYYQHPTVQKVLIVGLSRLN